MSFGYVGNGRKPTSVPPQPGCWRVAPFLPHETLGTCVIAARANVTAESLMDQAETILAKAMQSGQLSAAVSALKEKGVLSGKRIERSEIGAPGEFALQLRGVLVKIGGGDDDVDDGGAGDSTNVNQTFQPSGLLSWSNSP